MGLLSSKSLRQMAIGAGSRLLYRMDEARKNGEQGLADLKVAKQEVDEEVANLKKTYDSALTVGSSVGGGTFANFLFGTNDIEYISALGQMAPDNRNDAISELKKNFEALPQEERDKFEDYTKVSEQKFASDVNASKIKNGLQITNNMGNNTTNFLSRLMFEPPKDVKQKQEEVVSGFTVPEIQAPAPVTGAYEAISMTPSNMGNNTTNFLSKLMFEAPKDIREKQEAVVSGFTAPEIQAPSPVTGGYESIQPATSSITIDQGDILSYLKNTIDTLGFGDKEARTAFENDYNTLVTGTPEDKAKVVQKYYYPVYQTKVPIYPTGMGTVTGQIDEVDYTDIIDDTDPNYSG